MDKTTLYWTTQDELNYIDNIGSYCHKRGHEISHLKRLLLVRKGLEGIPIGNGKVLRKKNWGSLNKEVIMRYCLKLIVKEQGRINANNTL